MNEKPTIPQAMDLKDSPEYSSSYWNGHDVSANEVKRALVRLLEELNPPSQGGFHPSVRAALLSRIIRVAAGVDDSQVMEALEELRELRPSRTIVVTTSPESPSGLDAYAAARCRLAPAAEPPVCQEEIYLQAGGELSSHLSSLVSPLLIPDMPVSLWWVGPIPDENEELLKLCDRLVINSAQEAPEVYSRVQRLVEMLGPRKIVTDLAWSELAQWRELLARLFDPPETRQFQRAIDRVEVHYSRGSQIGHPLMLVAWLAAAFGWETPAIAGEPAIPGEKNADPIAPRYSFGKGAAEARILPVDTAGAVPPGGVLRVAMSGELGGEPFSFSAEAEQDGQCAAAATELPGRQPLRRMVPINRPSWATLLTGELDRRRPDRDYQAALAVAVPMVDEMRGSGGRTSSGGG